MSPRPAEDEIAAASRIGVHRGEMALDFTGRFNGAKVELFKKRLLALLGSAFFDRRATWLDIGCGFGELLQAIGELGQGRISAVGLEPNDRKRASAKSRGLDVRHFDSAGEIGRFDCISLMNVYSHVPDPVVALLEWRELLPPGGFLIVETGDTADLPSYRHPRPFYLPDHLSFGSESTLQRVLASAGFHVLCVMHYPIFEVSARSLVRETVKAMLPGKRSELRRMFRGNNPLADMFILAKRGD